jgi:hypothetical protein
MRPLGFHDFIELRNGQISKQNDGIFRWLSTGGLVNVSNRDVNGPGKSVSAESGQIRLIRCDDDGRDGCTTG